MFGLDQKKTDSSKRTSLKVKLSDLQNAKICKMQKIFL